jgi:acetyl-CoA carboxylase biotin carboxyl carrier protein
MSDLTERDLFQVLELFNGSDMTLLHVRSGDFEVLLSRNSEAAGLGAQPEPGPAAPVVSAPVESIPVEPAPTAAAEPPVPVAPPETSAADDDALVVPAPSLGAFYHAPRPDLPPYVEVGSRVDPETTVGLIEAMKVFTAVSAGVHGVVAEFLAANNEFVEFGQPLLRIKPDTDSRSAAR